MGPYDVEPDPSGRRPRAAAAVRVLGARGGVRRRQPLAGVPVPHGLRRPHVGQHGADHRGEARLRRLGARRGARERAAHGARGRARRAARQGQLGLELVRGQDGAGVPLLQGRGHRRATQQPVRARLRPARTGAPAGACSTAPALDEEGAHVELVRHAARALGIGTAQCLRDYFRLAPEPTSAAIATLVDDRRAAAGHDHGLEAPGLPARARRPARARCGPGRCSARSTRSIFERTRTELLFDFRYRIEIYVPAHKRVHGYYVLPFLLGDRLVARVDLKADRAAGVLRVHGAWAEPHAPGDDRRRAGRRADADGRVAGARHGVRCPAKGDLAGRSDRPPWPPPRLNQSVSSVRSAFVPPKVIDKILRMGEGKILRQLEAVAKQVNALEDEFDGDERRRAPGHDAGVPRASRRGRDPRRPDARGVRRSCARPPSACSASATSTSRSWAAPRCTSATSPR